MTELAAIGCCCGKTPPGGCWYLAQACCPQIDQRTLAYPCSEPDLFGPNDPPSLVTIVYQGDCFTLYPTAYTTHQTGWIDIAFADIEQIVPDCTDPACGEPCVRYYQPLLPCCASVGSTPPPIAYGDCDPQYWFGQAGVGSFKIGAQCYKPDTETVGGQCTAFATPPPTYIGPGPYSFPTYPTCEECCEVNPPPPTECPTDCTECSDTGYRVIVPPATFFVSSAADECCTEPGNPPCQCPGGDCLYAVPQVEIPIHKPGLPSDCNWVGNATVTQKRTGCCVGPNPDSFVFEEVSYFVNSLVCTGVDAQGYLVYLLTLSGAVYQRVQGIDGCPVGTYQKISPYKIPADCINNQEAQNPTADRWPFEVTVV